MAFFVYVYLCIMCMTGAHGDQKMVSYPLELELQAVVSCRISAKNPQDSSQQYSYKPNPRENRTEGRSTALTNILQTNKIIKPEKPSKI